MAFGFFWSLDVVWICRSRADVLSVEGVHGLMMRRPLNRERVRFQDEEAYGSDLS